MRLVLGIVLSVAFATSAQAFTKREIADAAYHWGRVDFAAEKCKRLAVNTRTRDAARGALEKGAPGAWKSGYSLGKTEAAEYFTGSGEKAFCQLSWVFYGREGQTVKNMLMRR